jgi:predicted  nucleic acid-binding Zn-ribbon protein
MLLFDDSKKLEKALGEETATVIAHAFEKADEKWRRDLATKADLLEAKSELRDEIAGLRTELRDEIASVRFEVQAVKSELRVEIQAIKNDILKWVFGISITQTALIVAVLAFLKLP